jgi:hypothetical protein
MAGMDIDGKMVCHRCDNPSCVNPSHLFAGVSLDNVRDMIAKDRNPRGERNIMSKLSPADVLAIRSATGLQRDIAARFGITQGCVSSIKSRTKWRHLK